MADYGKLIEDPNYAKIYYHRLEVLKMEGVVQTFFQLIFKVPSKLALDVNN